MDTVDLTPEAAQDLRNRATADFIAALGVLNDAMDAEVDFADYLGELSKHWTADHARQGLMVCGMVMASAGIEPEALVGIGRALITP